MAKEKKSFLLIPLELADRWLAELTPNCKDLFMAIMCFYNHTKGSCGVSDKTLMAKARINSRSPFATARATLRRLKFIGYKGFKQGGGAVYFIPDIGTTYGAKSNKPMVDDFLNKWQREEVAQQQGKKCAV